jgi:hypothetical protein
MIDIRTYGAKPMPQGGSGPDNTVAIQAAIDDAAKIGDVVVVPAGRFLWHGAVLPPSRVGLIGAGCGQSVLVTGSLFTAGDIVRCNGTSHGHIRDLGFNIADANSYRKSGAAIHLSNARNFTICDVAFEGQYTGLHVDGSKIGQFVDRCVFKSFSPFGAGDDKDSAAIWLDAPNAMNELRITNSIIMGTQSPIPPTRLGAFAPRYGIRLQGGVAWMNGVDVAGCEEGLVIDPPRGNASFSTFSDSDFDSCNRSCLRIQPGPGAEVNALNFSTCWSATTWHGNVCLVDGSQGRVDGVRFVGHRFLNCISANGAEVINAANVAFDSCVAAGCQNGSGFSFRASDFAVRNCHAGVYGAQKGIFAGNRVGIFVSQGCRNFILLGNILKVNEKRGIVDLTDGNANKVIQGNLLA